MSTRASATPRPTPRSTWFGLVLLTIVIALVHLLALGLAPAGMDNTATPLASKFSTRTIVFAPPAAPPAPTVAPPVIPKLVHPAPKPPPKAKPTPPPPAEPPPTQSPEPVTTPPLASALPSPLPPDPAGTPEAVSAAPEVPAGAASDPNGSAAALPDPAAGAASTRANTSKPDAGARQATGGPNENIGTGTRAMKIPGSTRLEFSVSGQQGATPYQGGYGELAWLQNGTDYDAQLTLKLLFFTLLNQHSSGHIGSDGLAPDRFADKRRNRTELAAHFVRDSSRVVFSNNKPNVPLQPGAQDRLSVMVQLGALLAGDAARYPPGSTITVQTVGTSDADIWTFNVEGDETLELPAGTYQTRKLSRNPRREFDDKAELWMAADLGYLPVRLRYTQAKGDFFDIQLRSVSATTPN